MNQRKKEHDSTGDADLVLLYYVTQLKHDGSSGISLSSALTSSLKPSPHVVSSEQGKSASFQMQPQSVGTRAARLQCCSVTSTCKSNLNQAAAPPVGQDAIVHTRAKVFFIVKKKN